MTALAAVETATVERPHAGPSAQEDAPRQLDPAASEARAWVARRLAWERYLRAKAA